MARSTPRAPLAERMRPRSLDAFIGQHHLLDPGGILHDALDVGELPSIILWGPPGVGKTTLARLIAEATGAHLITLSAVMATVKDIRAAINRAREDRRMFSRPTVLFVDELHRFNKAQQDALLPHVESGLITLIGATTENPGFEVNRALQSRARVLVMHPLTREHLVTALSRALEDEDNGLGAFGIQADDDVLDAIASASAGDARAALSLLEVTARTAFARARRESGTSRPEKVDITLDDIESNIGRRPISYDKKGDGHYRITSAFIKSMRGSDPNASLYYMNRMLEGGEDPKFIFRRVMIFASEDIGMADPMALIVATSAQQVFERVGMPEGGLALTQAVLHCALAPKSNSVIASYKASAEAARLHGTLPVPAHIGGSHIEQTSSSSAAYAYPHAHEGHHVRCDYLPDALVGSTYYVPSRQGDEEDAAQRLVQWWGEESD